MSGREPTDSGHDDSILNNNEHAHHQAEALQVDADVYYAGVNNREVLACSDDDVLAQLNTILDPQFIQADPKKNEHYRVGWRSGGGSATAVVFPQTLVALWQVLKVCVSTNAIIVMQAANTGLTEGSTPSGNQYDRPVIVVNTLAMDNLYLLNRGEQVVSLPGATLHQLEKQLGEVGRAPHSVIGSSCLGASIVGGVANNSGGALVKRGPAYTELSIYAQINEHGELCLVNHLGIDLGDSPESILNNLQNGQFSQDDIPKTSKLASDREYVERIRDVEADTPSRFNADHRRLYEASGCAGKLAVFAVRLDTYPVAEQEQTFYIGTNSERELAELRRQMLRTMENIPEVGEYMHRDIFDVSKKYGKDTFLSVLHLGTDQLPKLFSIKGRIDAVLNKISWLPNAITDKCLQLMSYLFPSHLPKRLLAYREKYEHHLILKMSNQGIHEAEVFLNTFFKESPTGDFFICDKDEAQRAYLHRFAAAGAAIRYQTMREKSVGDILALDIAIPRNQLDWLEKLPPDIEQSIDKKLYYGHFFCYVFHQDYILKKGSDPSAVKKAMLNLLNQRGAKYPAEHNVGHLYEAEPDLRQFYQELDPTNTFNPGIGKMEKTKRNCSCCH
ncbi:D-lactate dehydrogenase [Alteromonas sp. W364]|jgi:D-lactate dehydrogenase|uniref:D-lactate dehydrogenase n=1 Tax=Alteromonas sp. W364 TaxID=3075610 RepID=UPI0028885420|nr:D-lactate dehydrogenase [Alteromonas sp. W364]MDT0626843.1 D-lactate dehydrogenase [Alteromonas sp. W364]